MTHDELQAIKARADAATPGPWKTDAERPEKHAITLRRGDGMVLCEAWKWANVRADAEFIAHARTDVPNLVAEVERLRSQQPRVVAILSGGDWSDAGVEHVRVRADFDLVGAEADYRAWLRDMYHRLKGTPDEVPFETFVGYLKSLRWAVDAGIEEYRES